jgi:phosphoglycolate phosphatase
MYFVLILFAHSRPPPMGESCMGTRNLAIFDFDGTIADSAEWFGNALNELARHNGFREISAEQREMLRGRSTREIFAYLEIPSWKLPLLVRQLREIAARDVGQISIFPWVPDTLSALQSRGISIAIVSSNTKANIGRVLGTEVASMIDQFGTGAPLFGKAAKINAVIKRCASSSALTTSIGDEVRDIEAARTLGICSLAVTWGYATASALEAAQPTRLVHEPVQLLDWFAQKR